MNSPIPPTNGQPATPAAIRAAAQVAVAFYAKYRAELKAARAYLDEYDLLLAQADEGRDIRIIHERESLGYGQKGYAYMADDEVFCEFKLYQNGNVHIKFNKDFIRALNVEVSRELGWIQTKEDIAREFPDEMAKDAEQYFESTHQFSMTSFPALMNSES